MVGRPNTTYARAGDVCIAYQVVGEGERDIILPCDPGVGSCDLVWEDPIAARFLRRLAKLGRLILFDVRGVGSSSPMVGDRLPPLQALVDDLLLVMDEVESERAVLISPNVYAPLAWMFAAAHPNRAEAVVGFESFARLTAAEDYPYGMPDEMVDALFDRIVERWGSEENVADMAPSRQDDGAFVRWLARAHRLAAAPTNLVQMSRLLMRSDLRAALPSVQTPVLLLTRGDNPVIAPEHARYVVEHLDDARFVEIPGADFVWGSADADVLMDHIEQFLTGIAVGSPTNRMLATVLFTDIVNSTATAEAVGDDTWTETLDQHNRIVRRHVESFGGRWIKSTGDGAIATFDAPARGVLCADGLRHALADIGVDIRAGLHTGEIQLVGDDIAGIGVHIAARVAALADAQEVLVSATVPPLVVGSSLEFEDRGSYELKGVAQAWQVHRLIAS